MDLKKYTNWFLGAVMVLVGILLLFGTKFCIKVIVVAMGVAAVVDGVYCLIYERPLFENKNFQTAILVRSLASVVIGALAVVMPLAMAGAVWKVMTFLLAVFLILSACVGFFASSQLKDSAIDRKQLVKENLLCLIAAVILILIGPEKLGVVLVRIIGVVAIVVGAVYILLQIKATKSVIVVEAEVKDADTDSDKMEETVSDDSE